MACSNPEFLAAMVEGRLDPKEREDVLDHAAACDDCRHALLVLGTPRAAKAAAPVRPTSRSWIPWAAAAVFAVSVVGLLLMGRRGGEDNSASRVTREIPAKSQELPEPPKPPPVTPSVPPKREEAAPEPRKTVEPALTPEPPIKPAPEKPQEPAPPKPPPTPEAPKAPTIVVVALLDRVEGDVHVLSGSARVPAKPGHELRQGDGLEVKGARSWALVMYPDKTRLELEGETLVREMTGREAGKGLRLLVEKGAVRAEVSKQPAGQAMILDTPHGEARILGTTLRVQVDLDPKKGTHLEVEEGKVELHSAAGKSVLVESGHVAIAAAGVALAAKRLPKEELLLAYDFEDGKKPAGISKGTVERGPERRLCLSGEADAAGGSRLFIGDDPNGLFTCTGEELLSFDYWVDAQTSSVNFSLWNRTQKQPLEAEIPKMVVGKWTHVSLRLAELGDPAVRLKEGDWAVSLLLQATGNPPRKFYVDNVVLTRPKSLKPRAAETK
jgi:ferric-dicitrate binding protein FerR (iron transport regulator)